MIVSVYVYVFVVFFFKQKTAYEMRISDWSSDVCSSDLLVEFAPHRCAIERLDGLETSRFDERHHRSEGRRQRNHEAGAARDLAVGKQLLERPIGFERRRRIAQRREDRITRRVRLPGIEID